MKKTIVTLTVMFTSIFCFAQTKDIVEVAVESSDHTTLVTAVKAADLIPILQSDGPFTVFAPTNKAFGQLPKETMERLLLPDSKDALTGILTYHVVAGSLDAAAVLKAIKDGNGKAVLTTLNGASLTASLKGKNVVLTDSKGGTAIVTATDLKCTNGMIHVIDKVILP